MAKLKPDLMRRTLLDVCDLLSKGTISPICPISVYSIADTEKAFRALQSGKVIGKRVVNIGPGDKVIVSSGPGRLSLDLLLIFYQAFKPKLGANILRADATYILIEGTGGLGRSIAKWISSRGARNIVLVSCSATASGKPQALINELASSGTKVLVCK